MIDAESALHLIEKNFIKIECERVPLDRLVGRILMEPIEATRDQPPFNRVAMDGIAVCFKADSSGRYRVEGMQRAGRPKEKLKDRNDAIEVMTGATLPIGADTVIPYEHFSMKDGIATLKEGCKASLGKNIHRYGSDYKRGHSLLAKGDKLTSAAVSLIASQGSVEAVVAKMPEIAVISTGDELVGPGLSCKDWQIWRSNSYGICAELKALDPNLKVDLFHLQDDATETLALLSKLLQTHQILILSGGVSMGKYDFVHSIMNDLQVKKIFHKIKQKPGKPMYFGIGKDGQNVFGLPGNPVSALVCMKRYIIAGLEQAFGGMTQSCNAVLESDIHFAKDFTLFAAVTVKSCMSGMLKAYPVSSNGSGDLSVFGKSSGFLQLPENKRLYKRGEVYPYFPWAT